MLVKNKDPFIEYTKPKQTTKSSPLWASFHQVSYKKIKQDLIQCDACKIILIYKSTDGTKVMLTHNNACKKNAQLNVRQQPINAFMSTKDSNIRKIPSQIKKSITNACTEFAAIDSRAFETMSGGGFTDLIGKVFTAGQRMSTFTNFKTTELLPDPTTVNRICCFVIQEQCSSCIRLVGISIGFTIGVKNNSFSCVDQSIVIALLLIFGQKVTLVCISAESHFIILINRVNCTCTF